MSNYILEQLRKKGIENHNKMKEQNERRQHYLDRQSQSVPDFRQLYKDMSEESQNRVRSVISFESAEDDLITVLAKANIHKSKSIIERFQRIFSNEITPYQLRELAKVLEEVIDDTIENTSKWFGC